MGKMKTLSNSLASLLPESNGILSEKLSSDELVRVAGELNEVDERLSAQATGNQKLKDDLTAETERANAAQSRVTELETELASLQAASAEEKTRLEGEVATLTEQLRDEKATAQSSILELQTKLSAAEADRDTYKQWFDKQSNGGKTLPASDATSQSETPVLTPYDAEALSHFRKVKGE